MSPRFLALESGAPLHYSLPNEAVKLEELANVLGLVSGLRVVSPHLPADVTVATAIAMHITYAIVCRILAAQRDRWPGAWLFAGFVTGVLSVVALLVLGDRTPSDDA